MSKKIFFRLLVFSLVGILFVDLFVGLVTAQDLVYVVTMNYSKGNVSIVDSEISHGYSPRLQISLTGWFFCLDNSRMNNMTRECYGLKDPTIVFEDGREGNEMVGGENRVNESLFNILVPYVDGLNILRVSRIERRKGMYEERKLISFDLRKSRYVALSPVRLEFFNWFSFLASCLLIFLYYFSSSILRRLQKE